VIHYLNSFFTELPTSNSYTPGLVEGTSREQQFMHFCSISLFGVWAINLRPIHFECSPLMQRSHGEKRERALEPPPHINFSAALITGTSSEYGEIFMQSAARGFGSMEWMCPACITMCAPYYPCRACVCPCICACRVDRYNLKQ
jgi:hypothetical protein